MAHHNAKPGLWAQNATSSRAVRALMHEYQSLQKEPVEGFRVRLLQESDLFHWEVAIFGPPSTPYQGGYFKANMKFPHDYPFSPPLLRFTTKMWHPNVYENGDLCISILHPPSNDPYSDELACERWNPTQNVRTILMSVISLLNEPNISSPANVDASVMWRRFKEQSDGEYERVVRGIVSNTLKDAERDNVVVPTSVEDYCLVAKKSSSAAALGGSSSSGTLGGGSSATATAASSSSRSTSNAHFDSLLEPDEFYDDEDFYDEETDEEDDDEEDVAKTLGGGANSNGDGPEDRTRKHADDNGNDDDETEEANCDKAVDSSSSRARSRKGSNALVPVHAVDTTNKNDAENVDAVVIRRQRDDAVSLADDEGHVDEAGDASCVSTGGDVDDAEAGATLPVRSTKSTKDRNHRVIASDALTNADDVDALSAGKRRGSAEKVETSVAQQSPSGSTSASTRTRSTTVASE